MIQFTRHIIFSMATVLVASCTPVWAGYTIFTYPQVSPEYIVARGAYGPQTVKNYGTPPALPVGATVIYRPTAFNVYSPDVALRVELLDDPAGTDNDSAILIAFPEIKTKIIADILDIRAKALDKFTKNSGVAAVYDENYQAAVAVDAGEGNITLMRNGMTATTYMTGFGARLGMTAAQFAAYIISENHRVGPAPYQIEDEYLRLAYGVIPNETSVASLMAYPTAYRTFCGL